MKLPVGLVYDPVGKVVLDPDLQVQAAVRTFFETFRRTGSATSTVRSFREQGLLFPRRLSAGPHKGELVWGPLLHHRASARAQEPALRRRLRVWTQPGAQNASRKRAAYPAAARAVAHADSRRAPWLHHLGRL